MAEENKITHLPEPILESNGMRAIFQKNGGGGRTKKCKKGKKGQNIWKYSEQKCTKFEDIFKKGTWLCAIITRNKLLEKTLPTSWNYISWYVLLPLDMSTFCNNRTYRINRSENQFNESFEYKQCRPNIVTS